MAKKAKDNKGCEGDRGNGVHGGSATRNKSEEARDQTGGGGSKPRVLANGVSRLVQARSEGCRVPADPGACIAHHHRGGG